MDIIYFMTYSCRFDIAGKYSTDAPAKLIQ